MPANCQRPDEIVAFWNTQCHTVAPKFVITFMKPYAPLLLCGVFLNAAAAEPTTLGTVTVQGVQHQERRLPMSTTVLHAEDLDKLRIKSIERAALLTPNTRASLASGVNTLTVRGIGGGGRNIGIDPRVGVYLDGVYIGQSQALNVPWLDLEQAVFLNGPQGTFFGRNSISGAVSLQSNRPTDYFSARGDVEWGSNNYQAVEGVVSGPLIKELNARVAVRKQSQDGYIWNRHTNDFLNNKDVSTGRVGLDWTRGDFNVWLTYDWSKVTSNAIVGQPASEFFGFPLVSTLGKNQADLNTEPSYDLRSEGVTVNAKWATARGELTSLTAHRSVRQDRVSDMDYFPADLLSLYYNDNFSSTSQELRWSGKTTRFTYQVGAYVGRENSRTDRLITIGADAPTTLIQVAGVPMRIPFGTALRVKPGFGAFSLGHLRTDTSAVFGNISVPFGKKWAMDAGARVSWETKKLTSTLDGSGSGGMQIASFTDRDRLSTNDVSPYASVRLMPSEQTQVYLTYATGYKSGGWNADFVTRQQAQGDLQFKKETVNSWELGVKSAHKTWNASAAVFYALYDDYQFSQFVAQNGQAMVAQIRNAAKVSSQGAEVKGQWIPNDRFMLRGEMGVLRARFDKFPNATGTGASFNGNHLPDAPAFTSAVGFDYTHPLASGALRLTVVQSYTSSLYALANNLPDEKIKPLALTYLAVRYQPTDSWWSVKASVSNVFNTQRVNYINKDILNNRVIQYNPPRTFVLAFEGAF